MGKTFLIQDVLLDKAEMEGLNECKLIQYIQQKFQQQLQRARNAFQQEFRNHAVVPKREVRKIHHELTERLEEKYGEKLEALRKQSVEYSTEVSTHKDEISRLKSLSAAQEAQLTFMKHHLGLEQKDHLKSEVQCLDDDLKRLKNENNELSQRSCELDKLVVQLRQGATALKTELAWQEEQSTEEELAHSELARSLRQEIREQQEQYEVQVKMSEASFAEYRGKMSSELKIREILSSRRSEALQLMEEERQRHIKSRTKPTPRIGSMVDTKTLRHADNMSMDAFSRVRATDELHLPSPPRLQQRHIQKPPACFGANTSIWRGRESTPPLLVHTKSHCKGRSCSLTEPSRATFIRNASFRMAEKSTVRDVPL